MDRATEILEKSYGQKLWKTSGFAIIEAENKSKNRRFIDRATELVLKQTIVLS